MHPILATFSIGGSEVVLRAYGTFYALAWIASVALATVIVRRRGLSWWRALVTFAVSLTVGVAGARALDLGVNWGYYADDPSRIYDFGFRGFALYGGLILSLITGALLVRAFQLPLWHMADGAVPALAVGVVFMRTGCFLNGCCFGTVTSLPWGVTYPPGSPAWAWQLATGKTSVLGLVGRVEPVHPTQLYEMIAAVALGVLSVWLLRRRTPSGVPFLVFALGFTLFRLGDHFLRAQLPTVSTPTWFYPLLYALISAGLVGLIAWRVRIPQPVPSRAGGGGQNDSR
ncbi:MAG: hypothetical protein A2133_10405 [Actinobacteria bacterium RBG_16_64_13]|nr:MAG: hypothetical protein A2133_10405 [Actinobacteria bacterium RBG_16_64_13]